MSGHISLFDKHNLMMMFMLSCEGYDAHRRGGKRFPKALMKGFGTEACACVACDFVLDSPKAWPDGCDAGGNECLNMSMLYQIFNDIIQFNIV